LLLSELLPKVSWSDPPSTSFKAARPYSNEN
jgi:hypothetical protein